MKIRKILLLTICESDHEDQNIIPLLNDKEHRGEVS